MNRKDILGQKDKILELVAKNEPLCNIAKQLNCKQETLVKYLKKLNINYSGQQGKKAAEQKQGGYEYIPAINYLKYGSKIKSGTLKEKLFKEGYKEKRCECCGITHWLDKEAPLELHHIDGDKLNNQLDNLQILCPNCHAFTENFCGKNVKAHQQRLEKHARLAELVDAASSNLASKIEQEFKSPTSHQGIYKYQPAELIKKINNGQVDKEGKITSTKLGFKELERRKELIINSGIDLTKYGWQAKVEKITGLTRHQIKDTVSYYKDSLGKQVFKRNS